MLRNREVVSDTAKDEEPEVFNIGQSQNDSTEKISAHISGDNKSIVRLMLDIYGRKLRERFKDDVEEKIKQKYEKQNEIEKVKYQYELLKYEREILRSEELAIELKKTKEELQQIKKTMSNRSVDMPDINDSKCTGLPSDNERVHDNSGLEQELKLESKSLADISSHEKEAAEFSAHLQNEFKKIHQHISSLHNEVSVPSSEVSCMEKLADAYSKMNCEMVSFMKENLKNTQEFILSFFTQKAEINQQPASQNDNVLIQEELTSLRRERDALKYELERKSQEAGHRAELSEKMIFEKEEELQSLKNFRFKIESEMATVTDNAVRLEKSISDKNALLSDLRAELDKKDSAITERDLILSENKGKLKAFEEKARFFEEENSKLLCELEPLQKEKNTVARDFALTRDELLKKDRIITELTALIDEYKLRVTNIENNLEEKEKALKFARAVVNELEDKIHEFECKSTKFNRELKSLSENNEALETDIEKVRHSHEDVLRQLEQETFDRLKLERANKVLRDEVDSALSALKEMESKLKYFESYEKDVKGEMAVLKQDIVHKNSQIDDLKEKVSVLNKEKKDLYTATDLQERDLYWKDKLLLIEADRNEHKRLCEQKEKEIDFLKNEKDHIEKNISAYLDNIRSLEFDKRAFESDLMAKAKVVEDLNKHIDALKIRNTNLENEREHLSKCLSLSQKALSVNETIHTLRKPLIDKEKG